jgi:hypothetical protein
VYGVPSSQSFTPQSYERERGTQPQRTELKARRPSKLEIEETKTFRLRVSSYLFDCEPNVFHLLVDNVACDKQLNIAQNKMNEVGDSSHH